MGFQKKSIGRKFKYKKKALYSYTTKSPRKELRRETKGYNISNNKFCSSLVAESSFIMEQKALRLFHFLSIC